MNKLRLKFQLWVYGRMRNNLVHRMRANGATWSRINEVLRALGQKQIMKVIHRQDGPLLIFGYAKDGRTIAPLIDNSQKNRR